MKRITWIVFFALSMAITSAAQEKPKPETTDKTEAPKADKAQAADMPTADDVIEKYIKALGGKEAIQKITSRSMKGSFNMEALGVNDAPMEMFEKAPNKSSMKIELNGLGEVHQVFDGSKAWSSDPMQGLRELSGAELAQTKREADFYKEINYKKNYTKLELKGKEKVGSSEAYVMEATPADGSPEKLYFDISTNLLVRRDTEAETAQGKFETETYLEDYKDVDGVKFPHTIRNVNPMNTMVIKITEIKDNLEIDDTKFNKPSGN